MGPQMNRSNRGNEKSQLVELIRISNPLLLPPEPPLHRRFRKKSVETLLLTRETLFFDADVYQKEIFYVRIKKEHVESPNSRPPRSGQTPRRLVCQAVSQAMSPASPRQATRPQMMIQAGPTAPHLHPPQSQVPVKSLHTSHPYPSSNPSSAAQARTPCPCQETSCRCLLLALSFHLPWHQKPPHETAGTPTCKQPDPFLALGLFPLVDVLARRLWSLRPELGQCRFR